MWWCPGQVTEMRRQGQYADSGVSRMMAAQLQQLSAQRMQHNSAMNHYSGQPDTLPIDEECKYITSKVEGQWQWDRDGPKGPSSLSSQLYKEGKFSPWIFGISLSLSHSHSHTQRHTATSFCYFVLP